MQNRIARYSNRRHLTNRFAGLLLFVLSFAADPCTALSADSQIMSLAVKSLLLDGQVIDDRIIVVGERGHILISADNGVNWQQQPAPTRATLTSVFFIDSSNGWAAGHDSVILQTRDGGRQWQQVYAAIDEERPILDLWFKNPLNGYAIGAYGLFLETRDGGVSWTAVDFTPTPLAAGELHPEQEPAEEEEEESWGIDFHLNQLAASPDGRVYIAAEAGNLYRSDDGCRSWLSLPSPYAGSFYGTLPLAGENLLAFGLRGHLFATTDSGTTWAAGETGVQATLNDGIRLRDGRIILAGLAGTLLISADDGHSFDLLAQADRAGIARVLQAGDGALILIGEQGVRRLHLPGSGQEAGQ